jgi:predicted secreted Zn-dependent protease
MILILKKTNGRRSFSENCRCSKIKEEHRDRHNEPTKRYTKNQKENDVYETEEGGEFRIASTDIFTK